MAKLHFKYGAMNSGKTTILLQTAHNYEERDMNVIIIKSSIDTKGQDTVTSRIGRNRKVDYLIDKNTKLLPLVKDKLDAIDCVLVDEVQFLTKEQVNDLFFIAKKYKTPVVASGLKTDFRSNLFEGSKRMLELADEIVEIPTICRCGKKARFNGRRVNGVFTLDGEVVAIDGEDKIEYESLCGECYVKKVLKR